ncbi:hypothetical protein [Runella salmonicolor]|jgi:hypothetical protein|uniref:Uncharacterized protein n=1 Tax=Runella salmonicolor TaxID=2950278 RepID=A0ABT1FJ50_9BACT|nr:hypothetical protein [Runella salmonicolor]MCP1381545.1 hypothetical protein [Runella salmonicolor]
MPLHFYFNLREELKVPYSPQSLSMTFKKWEDITLNKFDELRFEQLLLLRNFIQDKEKFDFLVMNFLSRFDGGGVDFPQAKNLFTDYDNWKNNNPTIDFSQDADYFVVDRSLLENYILQNLVGKELIIKFGCNNNGSRYANLSIFIAGMARKDLTFTSLTDYIECNSQTVSPTQHNKIDNNFRTKTGNFSGRIGGGSITTVGVSHNIYKRGLEDGFLSEFLAKNPLAKTIYIHPAFDINHQGSLTVVFSTIPDIRLTPIGDWEISKVYNFGSGCCPPQ